MCIEGPLLTRVESVEKNPVRQTILLSKYDNTCRSFLKAMQEHKNDFRLGKFLGYISEGLNSVVSKVLEKPVGSVSYEEVEKFLFEEVYEEKMGMWRLVLKIIKKMQEISKKVYGVVSPDATNIKVPENCNEEKRKNFLELCNSKFFDSLDELREIFGFSLKENVQETPTPKGLASKDVEKSTDKVNEDPYAPGIWFYHIWYFFEDHMFEKMSKLSNALYELRPRLESSISERKDETLQKFLDDLGVNYWGREPGVDLRDKFGYQTSDICVLLGPDYDTYKKFALQSSNMSFWLEAISKYNNLSANS